MKILNVYEMFITSWNSFKSEAWNLLGFSAGTLIILAGLNRIGVLVIGADLPAVIAFNIGSYLLQTLVGMFWLWLSISIVRDWDISIAKFKMSLQSYLPYLATGLIVQLMIALGLILLVLPGLWLLVTLSLYGFVILDKDTLSIKEAIIASAKLTKGNRWQLSTLYMVLLVLNLTGLMAFGVGLAFTIPFSALATAHIYEYLMNENSESQPQVLPIQVIPSAGTMSATVLPPESSN